MPNDTKVTIDFSIRQNPKFENLKNLKNFSRTRISYPKLARCPSKKERRIVSRFSNFPEGFSKRVSIRFLFHFHKNVYKHCDDR